MRALDRRRGRRCASTASARICREFARTAIAIAVTAGPRMTDCLFCKIIAGQIPGSLVYEDQDVARVQGHQPAGAAARPHRPAPPHRHVERPHAGRRRPRGIDVPGSSRARQAARLRRARLPNGVQQQSRSRARRCSTSTCTCSAGRGARPGRRGRRQEPGLGASSSALSGRKGEQRRQLREIAYDRDVSRSGTGVSERCTSTPRIPTRRAPSISCVRLSPTITDSSALTPTSFSAASKMLGCGFM